jgi:hypothetical protein
MTIRYVCAGMTKWVLETHYLFLGENLAMGNKCPIKLCAPRISYEKGPE